MCSISAKQKLQMADEPDITDEKLGTSLSESLLTLLCFGGDAGQIASGMVTANLWAEPYTDIARRAIDYRVHFREAPGEAHIDDLFDDMLDMSNKREPIFRRILVSLYRLSENLNEDYVLSRVTEFMRRQMQKTVIQKAAQRIQQGGQEVADEVDVILGELSRFQFENLDPGTFAGDPSRALSFLDPGSRDILKLGIKELDDAEICPARGELYAIMGRRNSGKCIAGDERVQLPDGRWKPISDVVRDHDPRVVAFDERRKCFVAAEVTGHFDRGPQQCLEIRTRAGRIVKATPSHRFLTNHGWIEAQSLRVKVDKIAAPAALRHLGTGSIPPQQLRLLGYLISDGDIGHPTSITWTKTDPDVREDFIRCVRAIGDDALPFSDLGFRISAGQERRGKHGQNRTLRWLRELGLHGCRSGSKFVPDFIYGLRDEDIAEFLLGLFTGDSALEGNGRTKATITYTSASWRLVAGVSALLTRLGVVSRFKRFTPRYKARRLSGYARLTINSKAQIFRFLTMVGFIGRKADLAIKMIDGLASHPEHRQHKIVPLGEEAIFDEVEAVSPAGLLDTFDLSVAGHHNFIASNIIVHNSMFLTHLAKQAHLQKWRSMDMTGEMSEEQKLQRFFQNIFAISKWPEIYDQTLLELDDLGRLASLAKEKRKPLLSLQDPDVREVIADAMGEWGIELSNYNVKRFPTGSLTIRKLEAHLDFMEQAHNFVPDLLMIDGPQNMKLDAGHLREDLMRTVVDLRGIAQKRDMAVVVTWQGNRAGETARTLQSQHAGEDISIFATADNVITLNASREEQERGLARLFAAKVRMDRAGQTVLITQSYRTAQFCLQSAAPGSAYWSLFKEFSNVEVGNDDEE